MIQIRRSDERGRANYGWLQANYTFSFANYYDAEFVQFGPLRVLNQDRIDPGRGFDTHGHRDMEIVTYVLDGALRHQDSMGNGSEIRPGQVQLMSAGSGVTHSEFNASETDPLHLLQMWVEPTETGTEPRYEEKEFPESERRGAFQLIVSPDGAEGSLTIGQDARLYASLLGPDDRVTLELAPGRAAWLHLAQGRARVGEHDLEAGDGAAVRAESEVGIEGLADGELVVWEVADSGLE